MQGLQGSNEANVLVLIEELLEGFQFRGREQIDRGLRRFFTIPEGDFEIIQLVGSWGIGFSFTEDIGEVVIVFRDVQQIHQVIGFGNGCGVAR